MRALLSCLLAVLALLAGGCSAPDPSPAADRSAPVEATVEAAVEAAVDEGALHDGLAAAFAGDHPTHEDRSEGDCFADHLLATTTPEQLRDGGLTDSSYRVVDDLPALPEALAGKAADAQLACTDFVTDSARAQVSISKGRVDAGEYADCLTGALAASDIRASVVATLQGKWDDPAVTRLSKAQAACAKPVGTERSGPG